jgi:hypothetical protein
MAEAMPLLQNSEFVEFFTKLESRALLQSGEPLGGGEERLLQGIDG